MLYPMLDARSHLFVVRTLSPVLLRVLNHLWDGARPLVLRTHCRPATAAVVHACCHTSALRICGEQYHKFRRSALSISRVESRIASVVVVCKILKGQVALLNTCKRPVLYI